ncbi:DUF2474 domain-containing protein [Neorhizobium sp. LMR1-1-1.1]
MERASGQRSLLGRLLWLVGIWGASVLCVGLAAVLMKGLMRLAGMV